MGFILSFMFFSLSVYSQDNFVFCENVGSSKSVFFHKTIRKSDEFTNCHIVLIKWKYYDDELSKQIGILKDTYDKSYLNNPDSLSYKTDLCVIDLVNNKYKILTYTYYSNDGNVIYSHNFSSQRELEYALPGTVMDNITIKIYNYLTKNVLYEN